MADTWAVNNGSVGSRGTAEIGYGAGQIDPRLAQAAANNTAVGSDVGRTPAAYVDGIGYVYTPAGSNRTPVSSGRGSAGTTSSARRSSSSSSTGADRSQPSRTRILDPANSVVEITLDTFLQSLAGSLSSIIGGALSNILGNLPGAVQGLLNSSGLTGALGGIVNNLSQGLSNALGNLAGKLQEAGSQLFQGLGNLISSIPGIGPVFDKFSGAVSGLVSNISDAYGKLDPVFKAGVDGAIGAVGATVLNKVNIPGLNNIDPLIAGGVTAAISFGTNPQVSFNNLALEARNMDRQTFATTRNQVFSDLASACSNAAREISNCVTPRGNGFGFLNTVVNDLAENVVPIVNGQIQVDLGVFNNTQRDAVIDFYGNVPNTVQLNNIQNELRKAVSNLIG